MSVSNELSGEIVAAVLTRERSPEELQALKKMLIEVHATLQQMANYERTRESRQKAMSASASGADQLSSEE